MVHDGRQLWRWGVAALAIGRAAGSQHKESTAVESVVRLDVKRFASDPEILRLQTVYLNSQRRLALAQTDESPLSLASVVQSLATNTASSISSSDGATNANATANVDQAVEMRIRTGEGSHTITVFVGGQARELIIDTGSGKTAFVCEGCQACGFKHQHAPYRLTNNSQYVACDVQRPGDPEQGGCMECTGSKCRYGQRYVEGDYWEAFKMTDEMTFAAPAALSPHALKASVEFGCIYKQNGCFTQQSSDGIMGFSRHPDSIFEQFYRQKATQSRVFAQCLAADGGALTVGGVDMHLNRRPVVYTPLRDTGYQYWTVSLESISIGNVPLAVNSEVYNKERGCVFDSGTTFVYLPTASKNAFIQAWRHARGGSDQYLPLSDTFYRLDATTLSFLPSVCFHFPNHAQLCMKPEAYLYKLAENEYAGTIFFGDMAHSTIIGASALMHHNIIYDVDNNRIGMADADCDATPSTVSAESMIALELHPDGDTFAPAHSSEYWAHVSLAAVALFAVAGLVVTVWEEVGRKSDVVTTANGSKSAPSPGLPVVHTAEEEGTDFAFFLMPDDE